MDQGWKWIAPIVLVNPSRRIAQTRNAQQLDGIATCVLTFVLCENAGMELHDLSHVRQEIGKAMVAGIGMIFVFYAFLVQLPVQGGRAIFKPEVVLLSAVEIDGQFPQTRGAASSPG